MSQPGRRTLAKLGPDRISVGRISHAQALDAEPELSGEISQGFGERLSKGSSA